MHTAIFPLQELAAGRLAMSLVFVKLPFLFVLFARRGAQGRIEPRPPTHLHVQCTLVVSTYLSTSYNPWLPSTETGQARN